MHDWLVFLSSNYPYLLLIGLGLFFTQQTSPLLGLLRGLRYEDSDTVAILLSQGAKVLDMRDQAAFQEAHIKGARHITLGEKPSKTGSDEATVLYNQDGALSYQQISAIRALNYHNLVILTGGINAWKSAGLPIKNRRLK